MDKNFLYTGDESTHEETVYEKDFKITSKYTTYLEKNLRRNLVLTRSSQFAV